MCFSVRILVISVSIGVSLKAMRKMSQVSIGITTVERKWIFPLLASFRVMLILLLIDTSRFMGHSKEFCRNFSLGRPGFKSSSTVVLKGLEKPLVLVYPISGTRRDKEQMERLLNVNYHPRNNYLLHLDRQVPERERVKLDLYAKFDRVLGSWIM